MQGELQLAKTTLLLSAAASIFSSLMKLIVIEDGRFFSTGFVGLSLHMGRRAFLSHSLGSYFHAGGEFGITIVSLLLNGSIHESWMFPPPAKISIECQLGTQLRV